MSEGTKRGASAACILERIKLGDGLDAVKVINTPTNASITVCLLGGTLISFVDGDGEEKLFLSDKAVTDGSKAIRGGVPLVFPQFGKSGPLKQHGFARNSLWEMFGDAKDGMDPKSTVVQFQLSPSDAIREEWGADCGEFQLIHEIEFGESSLRTCLRVCNTGSQAFKFQALLHTYYRVADIKSTIVSGFESLAFRDQLTASDETESRDEFGFGEEVDRIYRRAKNVVIKCGSKTITIALKLCKGEAIHECDAVLWNPWVDKSKAMGDFGDEEFKQMLCVEPGLVSRFEECVPGETWSLTQQVRFSSSRM